MDNTFAAREQPKPVTVSEWAHELELARADLLKARQNSAKADEWERRALRTERQTYKAFNEAVAAMRPKRKPAVKVAK